MRVTPNPVAMRGCEKQYTHPRGLFCRASGLVEQPTVTIKSRETNPSPEVSCQQVAWLKGKGTSF